MKFALVLASDLQKKDWICYAIGSSRTEIENLRCYPASVIKIPKITFPGSVVLPSIEKENCETGFLTEFAIVRIENLQLTGKFNI